MSMRERCGVLFYSMLRLSIHAQQSRVDVLDISDNSVTVGILTRGRSPIFEFNQLARKRMALEAVSNSRLRSVWCDTHHQPCDGGTRPNEGGVLSLRPPIWRDPLYLLELTTVAPCLIG